MTDSKPYFASLDSVITRTPAATLETLHEETNDIKLNGNASDDGRCSSDACKYVLKAGRPNSKLILQNMEEVLNSVKKKHRLKHRRKREEKKLAQIEAAAVALASTDLGAIGRRMDDHEHQNTAAGKILDNDEKRLCKSKPNRAEKQHRKRFQTQLLKEQASRGNGKRYSSQNQQKSKKKSPLESPPTTSGTLRKGAGTQRKHQEVSLQVIKMGEGLTPTDELKTMNAFEVMMSARSKTIGSNTSGKDTSPTTSQEYTPNIKRKLMLQELADRKGGAKRKMEEEARAAFVDQQLENRAKRFKQMLVHGASPIQECTSPTDIATNRSKNKKIAKNSESNAATKQNTVKLKGVNLVKKRLELIDKGKDDLILQPDAETINFLSKLNSPTKKRDSLLGYFPRKGSPTKIPAKHVEEVPSNKPNSRPNVPKPLSGRISKSSAYIKINTASKIGTPVKEEDVQHLPNVETSLSHNSSEILYVSRGRPKRSCAGKARYDYDLEKSPSELVSTSIDSRSKYNEIGNDDSISEVIDLDDSNIAQSPKHLSQKLAPVFMRTVPKPCLDAVAIKARQEFLMSGVPEKMRLEMEKQKQYEQYYDDEALVYFPRVCHVQQFGTDEKHFLQSKQIFCWKLKPCNENDGTETNAASPGNINGKRSRCKSRSTACTRSKLKATKARPRSKRLSHPLYTPLPTLDYKRAVIKCWKSQFDRFPTYKCYNQMREKYRYFSAIDSSQDMEQLSESFVVTRRAERKRELVTVPDSLEQVDIRPPVTAPNGEVLFTEKYKPMLVEQVLVNLGPVTQLRDFLATRSNGNARYSQVLDDSFDNNSNSSLSSLTSNAVVLLGPVSSGKTNAVYALANDMNFNVLEINAGMKRTGKRLIQELQEATQSHQIRKDATAAQSISKAQNNLLRMPLTGKKFKQQNSPNHMNFDSNNSCNADQQTRKCLILIEDADIVFDQLDCGFTDAIYTLAASSKRPVIVVATNPNCPHLQRLMNQNTILFTPPNALNISRFMAVLSLIENCPISLDDLVSLYLYNGRDLRRTLLELQFFIQSGGDRNLTTVANETLQRKPQKCHDETREVGFFASPTKRRLSDEPNSRQSQESDEKLGKDGENIQSGNKMSTNTNVYTHRALFEFYTGNQNEQWRIPFPVDFSLLRVNLTEVLQGAQRLQSQSKWEATDSRKQSETNCEKGDSFNKRKTRVSKGAGLNNSIIDQKPRQTVETTLNALSDFYENISVAALLGAHISQDNGRAGCVSGRGIDVGGAATGVDRLLPYLSENIAHELVEQAISVDLAATAFPYNLFNMPTERYNLSDYLGSIAISSRSQRTRALDVEPILRAICRSEKKRATQERRSTRFYHYLRYSTVNISNFSSQPFDKACALLQESNSEEEPDESTQRYD